MAASIDSNSTQSYYGEETALGVQSTGPFYPFEPNTYSDWGADVQSVTRTPINIARQQAKGTTTGVDVAAGLNTDVTQNNLTRLLQGFFYADIHEKATNQPMNSAATTVASVSSTGFTLSAAIAAFKHGHLVATTNFGVSGNNDVWAVSDVTGAVITAAKQSGAATSAEAAPPATATIRAVGFTLSASAELTNLDAGQVTLTDSATDLTTLGLAVGEWVYLGDKGNATAAQDFNLYGNVSSKVIRGYGRISAIATHSITFDFVTFAGVGDSTAAVKVGATGVNLYFGSFLHNETTLATIKRRSYTLPRYLGKGAADADQLEVLLGCVPDKFTLNVKQKSKLDADVSFVGIDSTYSNAAMLAGTVAPFFNEKAFNTSADVFASLLTVVGGASSSLFAYASDISIGIDNGAATVPALGSVTGFDVSVGDFKVSGKSTVYFNDINAISAVRNNADTGLATIFGKNNAGMVYDVPLVTLGGGKLTIEKDKKITCEVTQDGAANSFGFVASLTTFPYLPDPAISGYKGL